MKYIYFVSYQYLGGHGNTDVTLASEIENLKEIRDIEFAIEKHDGTKDTIITSYQLLRTES
jgi:hypothetical protein